MDRIDVTYQQAFMATPQDKYYTRFLDNLVKINNRNGEPLSNDKLRQAVSEVREETDEGHERNINKITCNTSFQSPIQSEDESTINNSVYYESDEQVDTISDSHKQVDPRSDPKADTHIFDRIRKLSVGTFKPSVIGVIGQDLVTNVQENLRMDLSLNSLSLLNTNTSEAIVIGWACKSAEVDRNTLKMCMPPDRTTRSHSRIGTPAVNEGVFSLSRGKISSAAKWTGNIKPLDTSVHGSATQERNSDFSCIEKVGVKSLPDKTVADLDPSIRVNLVNSVLSKIPRFKNLGLPIFDASSPPLPEKIA